MTAYRWAFPVLLSAGLTSLPACVTTFVSDPSGPATPATKTSGTTDFGIYPKAPGERVALHPESKAEAVAVPPPPVEPLDVPTPTVAVTPPVVDPPLVQIIRAYLDHKPD